MSAAGRASGAARIIDANANRAREALRVMEDVARFALDDETLCARVKGLRHRLREALDAWPGGTIGLIASRDCAGDVGRGVSTVTERDRSGVRDVTLAATRRLTESLRSIEEGMKVGRGAAAGVERLRYEAYEVERALVLALGAGWAGFEGWPVCVVLTERLCPGGAWERVALASLEGGARCVQLREKELPGRELVARARRLVALAREFEADVVVNDRVDAALAAGAAGVHLGRDDVSVADARRLAGDRLVIGASVSSADEARAARSAGADYCGVGAMFPTTTKIKDEIAGPGLLKAYLDAGPALPPALAIGGIGRETVGELARVAGGRRFGVAVSSAVCGSEDPAGVCRAISEVMDGVWVAAEAQP